MNNIEAINLLEETISVLENKLTSSNRGKDLMNISVQTEIIRCEECELPAEDMHDLVDHMHGAHPLENDGIKCHDCWKEFQVQSDLVIRACHKIIFLDSGFWRVFFWCLFIVEMDPKDEILLKNEVLPCKNIIFAYKGKSGSYCFWL